MTGLCGQEKDISAARMVRRTENARRRETVLKLINQCFFSISQTNTELSILNSRQDLRPAGNLFFMLLRYMFLHIKDLCFFYGLVLHSFVFYDFILHSFDFYASVSHGFGLCLPEFICLLVCRSYKFLVRIQIRVCLQAERYREMRRRWGNV